jgi:tetratricopeptide (TPR) repeat protein
MANNKKIARQGQQPTAEETLNKQEAFFMKYKKAIIYAVLAVIVLIAGISLYKNYVSVPREAKASTILADGQALFAASDYDVALKGDGKGFPGFLKLASDYSSTKAGNLANLYAGLCYAQLDKWQEAANFLEKFDGADDSMISPAAIGALGNVYAHLNQLDKAVTNLKKAAEKADNNSLSPTFLIQAGEILESQGKKADALKLYQEVKDKYFNSMQYQTIDAYIERCKE